MSEAWPCGHPRTPENTQTIGMGNGVRCRECRRAIARESARRKRSEVDEEQRRLQYRMRYLPSQIIALRRKLAMLENEARRYGFTELLEGRQ